MNQENKPNSIPPSVRKYFQEISRRGVEAKIKKHGYEGYKALMKRIRLEAVEKRKNANKPLES